MLVAKKKVESPAAIAAVEIAARHISAMSRELFLIEDWPKHVNVRMNVACLNATQPGDSWETWVPAGAKRWVIEIGLDEAEVEEIPEDVL